MKSLSLLAVFFLLTGISFSQSHSAPALDTNNPFTGLNTITHLIPGTWTAATLPGTPGVNEVAIVTDAATGASCTVGGGSTNLFCRWTGSAWVVVAGGGGGGGGSGTVSANNGVANSFAIYTLAGGSTTVSANSRLTETGGNTLVYSGSGGVTASALLATPQINGTGTGGYKLVSAGATLPSTPGAGNNGVFSGPDGWYGSYQNDAWAKFARSGLIAASDITSGLISATQIDTTNDGGGLANIFPTSASFGNCPIYLGFTQAGGPSCNGLAQNTISATTYTILGTDLLDIDLYNGSTDSTWTLPAPTGGFAQPFAFYVQNRSTNAGRIIVTPSGSTIDGNATLTVPPGDYAFIYAVGSNWASIMAPPSGGVVVVQ